jgi:hypothetical protein
MDFLRRRLEGITSRVEQVLAIGEQGPLEARLQIERADGLLERIEATREVHSLCHGGTPVRRAILRNEARRCLRAAATAGDSAARAALYESALVLALEAQMLDWPAGSELPA